LATVVVQSLSMSPYIVACRHVNAHRLAIATNAAPKMKARRCLNTSARHYACRSERDWSDASQILVMVSYKRVAKCEKHDQPNHGAERCHEKCSGDLDTPPHIPPQKVDHPAQHDSREQPCVIHYVRG